MLSKKRCKGTSFFYRNQHITIKKSATFSIIGHEVKRNRAENNVNLFPRDKFLFRYRIVF